LVVGLLPLGTGGDFARTVGIHGVAHAIEVLGEGKVRRLDAMRARYRVGEGHRERYFVNAASIGLGAEVARAVNAGGSMLRGRARYLAAALRTLARGCSYAVTLRVDGAPAQYYNSTTIAIGNGRYQGGGMLLAPLAKADDGQIDVTVVDEVSLATVATNVSKLYSGSIYTDRRAHHLRGSRLSAESSGDVPFECDGELVGKLPVEIEVVAGAWRLLAPERAN
jgi:diacylglycerol kinase family enzyme